MAKIALFLSLFAVVYHYALYPLLVIVLSRYRPRLVHVANPTLWPKVTFLIAAYNEERVIADKLRNTLELDYPGPLEIVVVSDGSSDRTPEIVTEFGYRGVISRHQPERRGKTAALNRGVAQASGEIIVFSDANNEFSKDALRELVKHFGDPAVGGVCGAKRIKSAEDRESSLGDGLYWLYESAIKFAEGRIGSITNADGEIFAIRQSLYRPMNERTINDDTQITFDIVSQGYRVLYEPAAHSSEYASISIADDFHVKVRMVAGGFQSLFINWRLFLPPRSWFAWAFLSHKLLRWLAPGFLIVLFLASLWINDGPYRRLLLAQLLFYGVAFYGYLRIRRGPLPLLVYVPFYFSAMNLAALFGLFRFIAGRQSTQWRKAQR